VDLSLVGRVPGVQHLEALDLEGDLDPVDVKRQPAPGVAGPQKTMAGILYRSGRLSAHSRFGICGRAGGQGHFSGQGCRAMKIAITGGYGFIGSKLVALLIRDGHEVFILDNMSTSVVAELNVKKPDQVTTYRCDITSAGSLKDIALKNIDLLKN